MTKKQKHMYYRTTALLGAQQRTYTRTRPAVHIPGKLIATLVLVVGTILWLFVDPKWYLMGENLHVYGTASHTTAFDIAIASDLLGWHSFRLHPHAAEIIIVEKVPAVTAASVECAIFPASCDIHVTERTPVLNWIAEETTYWVDSQGLLFPSQEIRGDLPVVHGPVPNLTDTPSLLPVVNGVEALIALGFAPEGLEYNVERGLIWTDPEGRRIAFGTGSDMEPRWRIYKALVEHLEAHNVFPWAIDVRFPEGPTYSLERLW